MAEKKYINVTDTAKIIRKILKEKFPKQKFSVKSDKYSMGASIDITWTNGVALNDVEKLTEIFSGKGFDGMIDMNYSKTVWMLPDGSFTRTRSEGTVGSRGVAPKIDNLKPRPDAIEVHFGSDYVQCHREITNELKEKIAQDLAKEMGKEYKGLNSIAHTTSHRSWIDLVWRFSRKNNLSDYKGIKRVHKCGQIEDIFAVDEQYYDDCGIAIDNKEEDKFYCDKCHIELSSEEYKNHNGLCYECTNSAD